MGGGEGRGGRREKTGGRRERGGKRGEKEKEGEKMRAARARRTRREEGDEWAGGEVKGREGERPTPCPPPQLLSEKQLRCH